VSRLSRALYGLLLVYALLYPIAVIGAAFNVRPPFSMTWAGNLMLFLQGTILALWAMAAYGRVRGSMAALWVALLAFVVEFAGVRTGWPFGAYRYTGVLFPALFGAVPLAVVFAWLLVMLTAYPIAGLLLSRQSKRGGWLSRALLAALLAVVLDLLIEPVAVHVEGYWVWRGGGLSSGSYYGVPASNFVAWFVVALVMAGGVGLIVGADRSASEWFPALRLVPLLMYVSSVLLFALVNATHQLVVPAVLGALVLLVLLLVARRRCARWWPLFSGCRSAPSTRYTPSRSPVAHAPPGGGSSEPS